MLRGGRVAGLFLVCWWGTSIAKTAVTARISIRMGRHGHCASGRHVTGIVVMLFKVHGTMIEQINVHNSSMAPSPKFSTEMNPQANAKDKASHKDHHGHDNSPAIRLERQRSEVGRRC